MKKISVAMISNDLNINGISAVIMNYCENIDLSRIEMTLISGKPINAVYKEVTKRLGINTVELPARKEHPGKFYAACFKALRRGKYDIVHVHGNSATISIELMLAWMSGTKVRIAHSHNTTCTQMRAHKMLLPVFNRVCTHRFACGEDAGKWLFVDRKFHVIPNGFITDRYLFSEEDRNQIREELGIADRFVVGHIGRINGQKNQPYLLKIFEKLAPRMPNAVLLMVGTGPDYDSVKELVAAHSYKDRIIYYGESDNAAAMYSAIDVFVLPSLYEGLPVVLLEAQISGLPCVVSERVTQEVDFGNFIWASIDDEPAVWAEKICAIQTDVANRFAYSKEHKAQIDRYDIRKDVKKLEKLYQEFYSDAYRRRKN